jgi:hypothetical protein
VLLHNVSPRGGQGADLELVQPGAAGGLRAAIGATVEVGGPRPQKTQLYPANGHAGVSASTVHLGLTDGTPRPVTITWRDGTRVLHAQTQLTPGHHTVTLGPDGTVVTR